MRAPVRSVQFIAKRECQAQYSTVQYSTVISDLLIVTGRHTGIPSAPTAHATVKSCDVSKLEKCVSVMMHDTIDGMNQTNRFVVSKKTPFLLLA